MSDLTEPRVRSLDHPTLDVPVVTWGPDGPSEYHVGASLWLSWQTCNLIPEAYADEFWGKRREHDGLMANPFDEEFEEELEDAFEAFFRSWRRRIIKRVEDAYDEARWEMYKRHPELAPEGAKRAIERGINSVAELVSA